MMIMNEKKESNKKVIAIEKYTFEALKNFTLNSGKQENDSRKKSGKCRGVLDNNNINYSKW